MGTSKYIRPVLLLAGILGLLQSIIWFIMSLLGVLAYRCELDIPKPDDRFSALMYYLYFQGHDCSIPEEVVLGVAQSEIPFGFSLSKTTYANPDMINSWMSSYLALNITYMFISVALLVGYCRMKDGYPPYVTIRLWSLNTLVFLILDLWLTIIWGVDYGNLQDLVLKFNVPTFEWSSSVPGALMAITARGFILYVINLSLFIYLVKNAFPWNRLTRCWSSDNGSSRYHDEQQGRKTPQFRLPRVSVNQDPWDDSRAVVPYHDPARRQANEAGYQAYTNGGYSRSPQLKRYDSGRRRRSSADNIVHTSASYDRGYQQNERRDRDREEDIEIHHSNRQEPSFPVRGRPTARSVFDNMDRKNFEQGQGGPSRSYGQPMKVPPGARNNDYFY